MKATLSASTRIARQASREQRLATAGFVVDNSGSRDELEPQIVELWVWLQALPQLPADYEFAGRKDRTDAPPPAEDEPPTA